MVFKRKNVVVNRGPPPPPSAQQVKTKPHTGSRPSLVDSEPVVSTGSRSLDKALHHGGLPINTVTLIAEHGTTDFASAILKSTGALSIYESRNGNNSKVIYIGAPDWTHSFPLVNTPPPTSTADVSNEIETREQQVNMKIAWRYAKHANNNANELKPSKFCPDLDFKKRLDPKPQGKEIVHIPPTNLNDILMKIESNLKTTSKDTLVRILLPSFLHPAMYHPSQTTPTHVLPFIHKLKSTIKSYGNAIAILTLPLQLYPSTQSFSSAIELLCDTSIELEPFDSTDDSAHGFVHVNKISTLTNRGEMVTRRQELSFKLERKQFEVSTFSIPVDNSEINEPKSKAGQSSSSTQGFPQGTSQCTTLGGAGHTEGTPNLEKLQNDW